MTHAAPAPTPETESPLPTAPETLLARLDALGVAYTLHRHKAVFTVAEAKEVEADIPGLHCRNLFLRDRKKRNFLLTLPDERPVDLKKLPPLIGADKLSFGSAERLWQHLGVRPGSVCPFAVINDPEREVTLCLDRGMMAAETVCYHPLLNTMTVALAPEGLLRFIESCGHSPHIVDLDGAAPA